MIFLIENCLGPSEMYLSKTMTHSEFYLESDFIDPVKTFLLKYGFYEFCFSRSEITLSLPPTVFVVPPSILNLTI